MRAFIGRRQMRADDEQFVLHLPQISEQRRPAVDGGGEADGGIKLIDGAIAIDAGIAFADACWPPIRPVVPSSPVRV